MIVMEYAFEFPDDFDLATIRTRVAEKGPHFDSYPGLLRKTFLALDRRVPGPKSLADLRNTYATSYLWSSVHAAHDFLFGPDFAVVCAAFGRPAVRMYTPLALLDGRDRTTPTIAVSSIAPMPAGADLGTEVAAQRTQLAALGKQPGLHSAILSLDSRTWSVRYFSLWATAAQAEPAVRTGDQSYELLHLSMPGGPRLTP
ncbi:MAG: DUF4865 family protein [Pseudomonadota bacterium]